MRTEREEDWRERNWYMLTYNFGLSFLIAVHATKVILNMVGIMDGWTLAVGNEE